MTISPEFLLPSLVLAVMSYACLRIGISVLCEDPAEYEMKRLEHLERERMARSFRRL